MTTDTVPNQLIHKYGGADALAIGAKFVETMCLHGGLAGDQAVLDIGCGPGRMATAIGERFGWANRYFGFDIVSEDIAFCAGEISSLHPAFRFERVDVRNGQYNPRGVIEPAGFRFPCEDQEFDFAFAASVFTHMRTPETLTYIGEARRCLRPGGRFFATFFCLPDNPMPGHKLRFDFNTKLDEHCWGAIPNRPEKAVGYRPEFVHASLVRVGFGDIQFYPGAWAGAESRHSQDYFVATRI